MMRQRTSRYLASVMLALLASVSTAQQPQQTGPLRFEVAAIKPSDPRAVNSGSSTGPPGGTLRLVNIPLKQWVEMALSVRDYELKAPSWLGESRYDLNAKLPAGRALRQADIAEMMRQLLIERFALAWHEERRSVSGYELVVGKKPLLKASDPEQIRMNGRSRGPALIAGNNMPMSDLAAALGEVLGKPVVDATDLSGGFEVTLRWRPDFAADLAAAKQRGMNDVDNLPSIFTALEEQLGLRLRRAQVPVNGIVVDQISRQPTEN